MTIRFKQTEGGKNMPKPEITIRKAEERDYPFILKLNEADVEVLSPLDGETLDRMAI